MKEPVVVDSTCLIALERIGRLDLLPSLFEPIVAPPAVHHEFGSEHAWLLEEAPLDSALVQALGLTIDSGEAEALAVASQRGWRLVLDDQKARRAARALGIPLMGTVAILIRAKREGLISNLRPVIDALQAEGFRLSVALRAEALRLAGEQAP